MRAYGHLSDLPEGVRAALRDAEAPLREEDARLEEATLRALRVERLRARVPILVRAALAQGLSLRDAFLVVEIHSGVSMGHIRRLFYRR